MFLPLSVVEHFVNLKRFGRPFADHARSYHLLWEWTGMTQCATAALGERHLMLNKALLLTNCL